MATTDLSTFSPEYLAANQSRSLINVAITFAVLDTTFVSLFFFSRYKCHIPFGLDGWLMIPGYILCFAHTVLDIVLVRYAHSGQHLVTAKPDQITLWLKLDVVEEFIYVPSISFPKLAFLCLYLKVFTAKSFRYTTYATAGIIILSNVTFIIMSGTDCSPFAYKWDKSIPNGHCVDLLAVYRWVSIPNLVTDLITIVLPLPVIWRLHTGRAQKIGLTITFLTGCTGIVGAIVRFIYFFKYDVFSDITWYSVQVMTWTTAEPSIYLIAACLPALRPLFKHYLEGVDLKPLKSRLLGSESGSLARKLDPSDIQLPAVGRTVAGGDSKKPHVGFGKLSEHTFPGLEDDHERLVVCCGENATGANAVDHAQTDVEKGGIHVRRDLYLQRNSK